MEEKKPKVSFIPCLTWVKRGVASSKLTKIIPTKEELQEIMKEMKLRETEYKGRPKVKGSDEESDEENNQDVDDYYDMDNYDEEAVEPPGITTDINSMLNNTDSDSVDTDEEPDEFTVKPDDNLILCGHVDGDVCMLEAYVFNNEKGELFILNDMFLSSYPICIEWLDFNAKKINEPGNFAAVGSVTPEIGIWDISLSGTLEPSFKLGTKKKKTMRHTDAVLDLSWHKNNRSVLASGSADNTAIIWDMAKTEGITKIESFEEKVQSLKWHPFEAQSLLTGCCDGKVRLYDCRNPKYFKTWAFEGEIERVLWNDFDPFYYFATTDKGMVYYVDTRNDNPVWTLKAHDKETTGICLSSYCKDLLMTASMDETVKVWDLQGGTPTFVAQKNMAIGNIYALASCPDVPYVFCAGGSKKDNHLYVWDSRENDAVLNRFKGRKFEEATLESSDSRNMEVEDEPKPSTSQATTGKSEGRFNISKKPTTDSKELVSAVSKSSKKSKKKKSHKDMHPKSKESKDKS